MFHTLRYCLLALGLLSPALQADLLVQEPFARAVPAVINNSAAFMKIANNGAHDRAVVAAYSSVSKVVELHTHSMDEGVMRMRKIDRIELPAGATTVLKPGGLHIMLIGLNNGLEEGQQVDLELEFDDGSRQTLTAPVRKVMRPMKMKNMPGMKH